MHSFGLYFWEQTYRIGPQIIHNGTYITHHTHYFEPRSQNKLTTLFLTIALCFSWFSLFLSLMDQNNKKRPMYPKFSHQK